VNIGFGLVTCQRNPADPESRDDATIYAQAVELATEVERAGLDSYWVSEHHFWDDGYLPASLPLLAAAAAVTERITLGTAVLLAPLADPVRLAEDAAAVDLISNGRLVLGLGLGWREEEFAGFGVDPRRRVPLLKDTIATLRAAWDPDGVVGEAGVIVTPKPSRAGGPPIWIGGFVDAAVERAAALADGFVASVPPWSLDDLERHAGTLRSAARQVEVSAFADVFVSDGPEDAWDLVRDYQWYSRWKYSDTAEAHGPRHGRPPALAPPIPSEEDARAGSYVGRPEEVLDGLRALAAHVSPGGHLILRSYYPGLPWELQREQVRLLGELARELSEEATVGSPS
jgi:alkanesulfonate monooxygenase SsuD/methylene tetrahydromethanopterin reductase-like flavin-dependent oxidoreductase (luciferase family)